MFDRSFGHDSDVDQQDDDAINTALINAMNQMESTAKQKDLNANKFNEDAILKKQKTQVLAKYSEVSDEEFDYGDEGETQGNGLFHNTNTQEVEERDKKAREIQHEVKSLELYCDFRYRSIF